MTDNNQNDKNNQKTGERKLGRGIASLLANDIDINFDSLSNDKRPNAKIENSLQELDINDVVPNPDQPRKHFDETKLRELSESIKSSGLLQPIIVSAKKKNDKYVIIAGERRYRACKMAGLSKIRSIILDLKEQEVLKNAILENVQRENLNPVEEASGYKKIIEAFNYTHEQLAKEIGKSRAHITNLLRVLTLPEEVQSALRNDNITLGHAKVLLGTDNPEDYLSTIIEKQLSVRQLEKMIANGGVYEEENKKKNDEEESDVNVANITFDMIKQLYSPILKNNEENDGKLDTENVKSKILDISSEEWKKIEKNVKTIEQMLIDSCGFDLHLFLKQDGSGKIEINFENADDLLDIVKIFK